MGITNSSRGLAKGLTTGLAALVLIGGIASSASAGSLIFKDNFNRGHYGYSSYVGNGWHETQKDSWDVSIQSNKLMLRDFLPNKTYNYQTHAWSYSPIDAAATRWIDTTGYQNVYLMYDFKPLHASDYSDKLYVDFRALGNNSWTTLASHSLGGSQWSWNTEYFGSSANDTKLQLRFWTDVTDSSNWFHGGKHEGAYIDAVKIWGDPIPTTPTPEPSTMALFATGLVGMGLWRARRNKAEQSA